MAKKNLDADEVAKKHYNLLMDDKYEEWLKTLNERARRQADTTMRGFKAEFYWNSGRKWVTEYGIRYEFEREGRSFMANTRTFFFNRVGKDGKNVGHPVKIVMKPEDGEWKVSVPSY